MYVHEAFAAAMSVAGITDLFGLVGDGNLFLAHTFQERGGRYFDLPHEAGTVSAAAGYATVTGKVAAATVTHGPGLYNTLTALTDAARGRIPMVLIVGDTDAAVDNHIQDADHRAAVRITGAGFVTARTPEAAAGTVARAHQRAAAERRPIVLNVPAPLWWDTVSDEAPALRPAAPAPTAAARAACEDAVGLLASSQHPLVLLGYGATSGFVDIRRLAQRLGAVTLTTLRGKGLGGPGTEIMGTLSTATASGRIAAADVIVTFGASLNNYTTMGGTLLQGKRLIQVDADATQLGRLVHPDIALLGDAGATARTLHELIDEAELAPSSFGGAAAPGDRPDLGPASSADPAEPVELHRALRAISSWLPERRSVVFDAGRFWFAAAQDIAVAEPRAFVQTAQFGAIGIGMAAAIGAAVGAPDRPTLAVVGDGGLMLSGLAEFNAAVRHQLDLVVALVNDSAFGAEHIQLRRRGIDPAISTFGWPPFGPVAVSLGGRAATITTHGDLADLTETPLRPGAPLLIDIRLDPDAVQASREAPTT